MSTALFSITNLSCAYNRNAADKVLYIDQLDIPRGKLVFLLGASGCGKSTLLETLGLMNNTVANGSIFLHPQGEQATPVDITELWKDTAYRQLTEVRKKHYSFIFQNTNLMENFTAYENVCLSGMIKENVSQKDVLEKAQNLMQKVKLPESEVDLQTLAVNLSGGQRQRLAFVRALSNKATVLFGDEPTGNLDEANANELFETIKANLHGGLSAIVVSHDIDLAVKYADQIIVITKDAHKGYGEVHPRNIFNSNEWQNFDEAGIEHFKGQLRAFYTAGNEHKVQATPDKGIVNTSITYKSLFLRKEGKVLFGKGFINLWILSLILFFTFLAIGFANGGLDYLDKKMNSAFVQWVTIAIPSQRNDPAKISKLVEKLREPELKAQYHYENVTPYVTSAFTVKNLAKNSFFAVNSRSVDVSLDQRLVNEFVLNKKNVVRGREGGFKNKMDVGVIVSEKFLQDFHYPPDATVIYCQKVIIDTVSNTELDIAVPIPIRTVVKELPGKYHLIYPLYFYQAFINKSNATFDITQRNQSLRYFIKGMNGAEAADVKKKLTEIIYADDRMTRYSAEVATMEDTLGYLGGQAIQLEFLSPFPTSTTIDSMHQQMQGEIRKLVPGKEVVRSYDFSNISENFTDPGFDQISVYFTDLDKVREFANFLAIYANADGETQSIEVDVTKVKEKEDFNFLSKVTLYVSYLLVIFSTLAVGLFIFNLLKSHLSKVKMNIGTFKAIGLADSQARNIYVAIIFIFIALSTALALSLATLTGVTLNTILTQRMIVEQDISYFKIVDFNTAMALFIVLLSSFSISWFTINKILSKTPGDLIYNR